MSNPVKVGVIGAGKWGVNHLKVFSKSDCELVGLADLDESKKEVADQYNTGFFSDYSELLEKVDAVTIAVPTNLHFDIVKNCLNAGKHVLVEKPITLDSERAKELVDLAKEKGLILSVGYLFRFNSAVKELKRIMPELGQIQYITARYIHSTKPPRTDSGVIFNLGIHLIDIMNYILEQRPKKIFAKKINYLSPELEDSANILLDYGDFSAGLELSCCHPLKKRDMWIIGSKEKIYVDFLDQVITRYPIVVGYDEVKAGEEYNVELEKNEPLSDQLMHFCECVKNFNDSIQEITNIGEEEYYTTRICELSMKAAEEGKELVLE